MFGISEGFMGGKLDWGRESTLDCIDYHCRFVAISIHSLFAGLGLKLECVIVTEVYAY